MLGGGYGSQGQKQAPNIISENTYAGEFDAIPGYSLLLVKRTKYAVRAIRLRFSIKL